MKRFSLYDISLVAVYAALICITTMIIRVPFAGKMLHFGNGLVVLGLLLFGSLRGTLAGMIGLGIFDLLSGHVSSIWSTCLETALVCLLVYVVYDFLLSRKDSLTNIALVVVLAALAKSAIIIVRYTLTYLLGGVSLDMAMKTAVTEKALSSYFVSVLTVLSVLILYPVLKNITQKRLK